MYILAGKQKLQETKAGELGELRKKAEETGRDQIPNLDLNADKTEHFFYNNGTVEKIMGESSLINYLGFTFDGNAVRIRDKSLFKYYCRAYRSRVPILYEDSIVFVWGIR